MRDTFLKNLAKWHAEHPYRMLLIVVLLTIMFMWFSTQLNLTLRWADLLPENDPRTIQFNEIIEDFVTSTNIVVVVQGEEENIKAFADELAPRLLAAVDTSKNAEIEEKITVLENEIALLSGEQESQLKITELQTQIDDLKKGYNKKLVRRVDYKTEVDFLRNNGLKLIKEEDLKDLKESFMDPNLSGFLYNLNNSLEKEYVGRSESISTREKEDQAVVLLDGIQSMVELLTRYGNGEAVDEADVRQVVDNILIGEPYFISYDREALVLMAIPNFTMFDMDLLVRGTDVVQGIVDEVLSEYPGVSAGLTGFVPIGHDEMVYSEQSLGYTTVIAFVAIFILLVISFRMLIAPVFAMLNLIVGIIWAIGLTAVVVGQLNIMTQMMLVILLGLGIDFSIHLISGFTEWRALGDSIRDALEKTLIKSGKGIITGALTTAFAFLTMLISSSRGMKEMGLVTGIGLLAILVVTFLFLPALLVIRARYRDRRIRAKKNVKKQIKKDISFKFLGNWAFTFHKNYQFTMIAAILITLFLIYSGSRITFDQNYMNIEPEGLTSITLQDTVQDKFDMSMEYAMIIANDVDESRQLAKDYRDMGSVALTEDISTYLPSPEQQSVRNVYIKEIKNKIENARIRNSIQPGEMSDIIREIDRLQMNVMEMQDMAFLGGQDKVDNKCKEIVGDPVDPDPDNMIADLIELLSRDTREHSRKLSGLQNLFAPYFKKSVVKMCNTEAIEFEDLPETILDRYSNEDRDKFMVTIYPAGHVWKDAEFLRHFVDDLESVNPRATGMPPIFMALIEIIGRDGRNAVMLTIVIVFILLLFDFRSVRDAIMAMIPLMAGLFWMVGLMHLTGQQLTVMNVMGLPMILGIGIDDGVHIVHRWRHEGKGMIRTVFSSTGKAILLTSLTTMLAFGSLTFSIWRGFGHLGAALFVGVGACFVATVLILPGIIGWLERK